MNVEPIALKLFDLLKIILVKTFEIIKAFFLVIAAFLEFITALFD